MSLKVSRREKAEGRCLTCRFPESLVWVRSFGLGISTAERRQAMSGGHRVKTEHAAWGEGDGEGTPPFQGRWLGLTRILLSATHAWRKLCLQEKMSCFQQVAWWVIEGVEAGAVHFSCIYNGRGDLKTSVTLGLDGWIKSVHFQVLSEPCPPRIMQLGRDAQWERDT